MTRQPNRRALWTDGISVAGDVDGVVEGAQRVGGKLRTGHTLDYRRDSAGSFPDWYD